jgi:tRNA1(Val) A37 N6-methylase TrmN6
MIHTTITFNYGRKSHSWDIEHNLDEFGMSIDAAFINWSARLVGIPKIEDFCEYVRNKDILNFKCKPK